MHTNYLGLELTSPVIVSSSPYTASLSGIRECARNGAGAVVLKSIFEEQILHEASALGAASDSPYGDAEIYLQRYLGDDYKARFLQLLLAARAAVDLPVMASINCVGAGDEWIDYAVSMAGAGASALELNIFIQPTDRCTEAPEVEHTYTDIVRKVTAAVGIPVAVKMPMRLTNVVAVANALRGYGARGAVLFNRYFEPDIDIDRMQYVESSPYSEPSELRNVLRTTAICTTAIPQLDFAVSTGVHDGAGVVKALLCGAKAAQVCTAIHHYGFGIIGVMNDYVDLWAEEHGFDTIGEFCGRMNFGNTPSPLFQRVQYMKYFPTEDK